MAEHATTLDRHFRKRKVRTAPTSPRKESPASSSGGASPIELVGSPSAAIAVAIDGVNLSAALTALQVSLKRDLDSFIPPTPAASPIHSRASKRPRFDFGVLLPEHGDFDYDVDAAASTAASPLPAIPHSGAYLSVNKTLQEELKNRRHVDSSDHMLRARKRRQQLSYFAITGAFHRAALERERPLVSAQSVE